MDTNKGQGWKVLLSLAMIAAIAVLPYLGVKWFGGSAGKKEKTETGLLVMDRGPLVKSDPATFGGNSRAIDIEPMEGIRITAAPNALDRDRTFKVREATPSEWKVAESLVSSQGGARTFLVMDVDAGLGPNEVLPGTYGVDIDLHELGVPENLWPAVAVYRIGLDGKQQTVYRYNARVDNSGILHYESNQNCPVAVGIALFAGGKIAAWMLEKYIMLKVGKKILFNIIQTEIREYYKDESDYMAVPWQDPNGDFTVHFRWRDVADKEGIKRYQAVEKAVFERLDALREEAEEEYERRINAIATGKENPSWWEKWQNREAAGKAREVLLLESVYQEKLTGDQQLQRLQNNPDGQLPEPVQWAIELTKRAGAYLSGPAGLRPLPYVIDIFMMDHTVMGSKSGINTQIPAGPCYIKFGYEAGLERGKWSNTPKFGQSVLLTLTHELFHSRQQSVYANWHMDMNVAESTAAILEADAARWYYRNGGIVSVDIDTEEGYQAVELTPRTDHYIYARPLDRMFATSAFTLDDLMHFDYSTFHAKTFAEMTEVAASTGYTLADLVETIRATADKKNVGMVRFAENYVEHMPLSELIKKSLDIDDRMLEKGWDTFVLKFIGSISSSQDEISRKDAQKLQDDCYQTNVTVTGENPLLTIQAGKFPEDRTGIPTRWWHNYYVKTWYLQAPRWEKPFTAFIKPVGKGDPHIKFFLKSNQFKNGEEQPNVYDAEPGAHFLAMAVGDYDVPEAEEDQQYRVVSLFAPNKVEVLQARDDRLAVKIPEPESAEMLTSGFLSGAVLTYTDKNGKNKQTRPVSLSEFGKTIAWAVPGSTESGNGFSITMHWYYQADASTVYVSPESEPLIYNVKKDAKAETRDKDLTKPHWKMISREFEPVSTTFDPGAAKITDVRSVAFTESEFDGLYDFKGIASEMARDKKGEIVRTKEGQVCYEQVAVLSGAVAYTEPPRYWFPKEKYAMELNVYNDPFVKKFSGDPFVFSSEGKVSVPADCSRSGEKIRKENAGIGGGASWMASSSATFTAKEPGEKDPKSFTFTQEYTIAERPGSDRAGKFVLTYVYVWTGDDSLPAETEGPGLDGGYWRLVKTEVDDSDAVYESRGTVARGQKDKDNGRVSGGNGEYSGFMEWWAWADPVKEGGGVRFTNYRVINTWTRNVHMNVPRQQYRPGEKIVIQVEHDPVAIEGTGSTSTMQTLPAGSAFLYYYSSYNDDYDTRDNYLHWDGSYDDENNPIDNTGQVTSLYEGTLPTEVTLESFKRFVIIEKVSCGRRCSLSTKYHYEWVEEQQEINSQPGDINASFKVTGFANVDPVAYKDSAPVRGRLSIHDGQYTITIPAHTVNTTSLMTNWRYEVPALTIRGACRIDDMSGTFGQEKAFRIRSVSSGSHRWTPSSLTIDARQTTEHSDQSTITTLEESSQAPYFSFDNDGRKWATGAEIRFTVSFVKDSYKGGVQTRHDEVDDHQIFLRMEF